MLAQQMARVLVGRPGHGSPNSRNTQTRARTRSRECVHDRALDAKKRAVDTPRALKRMHVILTDILTCHGGWLRVEKEVLLSEPWSYDLKDMIDVLGECGRR